MSRIGKKPVLFPMELRLQWVLIMWYTVKGPKGELKQAIDRDIKVEVKDGQCNFYPSY